MIEIFQEPTWTDDSFDKRNCWFETLENYTTHTERRIRASRSHRMGNAQLICILILMTTPYRLSSLFFSDLSNFEMQVRALTHLFVLQNALMLNY